MGLKDRYASAVNAADLGLPRALPGRDDQRPSNPEILGAYALADRTLTTGVTSAGQRVRPAPLAVPLARLLEGGDEAAALTVVRVLTEQAFEASYRLEVRISLGDCQRMAMALLGWFRAPRCTRCGGHGKELIEGTPHLSEVACFECEGTGERPYLGEFQPRRRPLAAWMREEVERSLGRAAPQAMRHLAQQMEMTP